MHHFHIQPSVRRRVARFTLIELIVAMGVFSILMMMLLQFFSGAQKIWSSSEARHTRYADARAAMDVMASSLQSVFYDPAATIFVIQKEQAGDRNRDSLYFPVKSPIDYGSDRSLYYISFQLDPNDKAGNGSLYLTTFSDKDNNAKFKEFFTHHTNYTPIRNSIVTELALPADPTVENPNPNTQQIITGVTGLFFRPIMPNYSGKRAQRLDWGLSAANINGGLEQIPLAIEIKLTMLDPEKYQRWLDMKKINNDDAETFRSENEFTFSRVVYLGRQ